MKWALVDANQIILNTIAYDGSSPFTPPSGQTLQQVNDWLNIGDHVSDTEPATPVPPQQQINDGAMLALESIDTKSVRAIRSILLAMHNNTSPAQADLDALQTHETNATTTRQQIK